MTAPIESADDVLVADPQRRRWDPRSWSQRSRVLAVSAASLGVLLGVAFLLPVPFVKLAPGPVFNVIGEVDGTPVIAISGTTTYPVTGSLDMTTVLERGGPRGGLTFVDALASWFDPADAVVPRELLYPDDVSGEEVSRRQAALFSTSESDAVAAAMAYLDLPVTTQTVVTAVFADSPSDGEFKPRDELLRVDGAEIRTPADVVDAVRGAPVGTTFAFDIRRPDGQGGASERTVGVTSAPNPDDPPVPYIGISVGSYYTPEFDIDFTLEKVGGPSAGLMFAAGIVDKLTPDDLVAGRHVAGTGTITPDGEVGPIGGIRQKLAGARNEGAELFLMPSEHCAETSEHIPDGLTVVPVDTLAGAIDAMEQWRAGSPLPTCPVPAA